MAQTRFPSAGETATPTFPTTAGIPGFLEMIFQLAPPSTDLYNAEVPTSAHIL